MDKSTLEKLWTAVHLAAIYTGVNAILWLQNSPVTLPLVVQMRDDAMRESRSMAIFWCFIAGATLACSVTLALSYLKHHADERHGVATAPSMFGVALREGTALARAYQAFWLVLCMALAAYGVGHAARTVLRAPLYECDGNAAVDPMFRPGKDLLAGLRPRFDGVDVRFDGCGPNGTGVSKSDKRGVEYVPIVNDLAIGGIAVIDIVLVFAFWRRWRRAAR